MKIHVRVPGEGSRGNTGSRGFAERCPDGGQVAEQVREDGARVRQHLHEKRRLRDVHQVEQREQRRERRTEQKRKRMARVHAAEREHLTPDGGARATARRARAGRFACVRADERAEKAAKRFLVVLAKGHSRAGALSAIRIWEHSEVILHLIREQIQHEYMQQTVLYLSVKHNR